MKWAEISIKTTHAATELVAEIFHEVGSSGVVIEDPKLVNDYLDSGVWDYTDIAAETNTEVVIVKAYLPVDDELDDKLRLFKDRVDILTDNGLDTGLRDISCSEIQEEDWATAWKDYFHPFKIGAHIVIKPTWEQCEVLPDDVVIEIDPGMAFGTGTHHTTAMCVGLLEDYVTKGMKIFDVGAGSGILSIVAAKLGAGEVEAVDYDATAVKVAAENVALNGVGDIVNVSRGDLLNGIEEQADLIIANIIADVILRLLPCVKDKLKNGGRMIASGIIIDRLPDVTMAVVDNGLTVDKVIEDGGWAAMVIVNGGQ